MEEDIKSGRNCIAIASFIICIVIILGLFIDIFRNTYEERVMLDNCDKYSTTMIITKKEITGGVKHRRCNLYAEYKGTEYRMHYIPVSVFNSYEKGDSIECVIWVDDEDSIMKVQPLENT